MTHQDHIKIAQVFLESYPEDDSQDLLTWNKLRLKMASMLTTDNPRFNKDKFLFACLPF